MKKSLVILAAEDETSDVWLLREALRGAEVDVDLQVTRDGDEAIGYLQGKGEYGDRDRHPFPNLLLLDLKMPRMGGMEVLKWVRGSPEYSELPVLILSGSVIQDEIAEAYRLGVSAFFTKPSGLEQLRMLLRYIVGYWWHAQRPKIRALAGAREQRTGVRPAEMSKSNERT